MSDDARKTIRLLVDVICSLILLYFTLPGRPPLDPLVWRTVARGADRIADRAITVSLRARTRYWESLR